MEPARYPRALFPSVCRRRSQRDAAAVALAAAAFAAAALAATAKSAAAVAAAVSHRLLGGDAAPAPAVPNGSAAYAFPPNGSAAPPVCRLQRGPVLWRLPPM